MLNSKSRILLQHMTRMTKVRFFQHGIRICALVWLLHSCDSNRSGREAFSEQYQHWLKMAEAYTMTNPDSSLKYADSLLKNPKVLAEDSLLIPVLINQALALRASGRRDSCLQVLAQLPVLCKRSRDTANWSRSENIKAAVFEEYGQPQLVIKHASRAYELARAAGLQLHTARALLKIGGAYSEKQELVKAQFHLLRAYMVFDALDSLAHVSEVATGIANNYKTLGKLDSALWYGRLAVRMAKANGMPVVRAQAYTNFGILIQNFQPDSAIYWYKQSQALNPTLEVRMNLISIAIQEGDYRDVQNVLDTLMADCKAQKRWSGIALCHRQYSRIHEARGEWPLAAKELEEAVRIGDSLGIGFIAMSGRQALLEIYKKSGRLREAVQLGDQLIRLKDSIDRDEKIQAMQALQQYKKSEKLQQELERKQEESGLKDVTNRKQKQVIIALLLALTLLAIIIIKARARNRKRLAESNLLIRRYWEEAAKLKEQLKQSTPLSLFEQLVHYLEHDKPWLKPELKVADILEKLNCTRTAMTTALNQEQVPGLVYLVQQYRVKEAIRLMQDDRYKHYKIEAIGNTCGFGSYRSFHQVFVQVTGQKPADYRAGVVA
jgi:AraC-like DNA-binding protein